MQWLWAPAKPKAFSMALLWLMVLLVAGTLAQARVGLFQSYQTYFASWLLWWGWLPLPGALTTLAFIAYGLAVKVLREPFKPAHLGSWLAHAGVLLLLAGGLLTFATAREGYITLRPNQSTAAVSDYYSAQLTLQRAGDGTVLATLPADELAPGRHQLGPLTLDIRRSFTNTQLLRRNEDDDVETARGMFRIFTLEPAPPEMEAELNRAGLVFMLVSGSDADDGATFGLIEDAPIPQPVMMQGERYHLLLQPAQTPLPFTVTLATFTRTPYPGTVTAQAYRSDVTVTDGAHTFPAVIEMNRPLRYKGYTLYQASYTEDDGGEASVLAVVHNRGRVLPYWAGGIMALGLVLQFLRRLKVNPKTLATLALLMLPLTSHAQPLDLTDFGRLPVQHDGRIKPLDSMARSLLATLAEQESLAGESATAWLASAVFAPQQAQRQPVIRIRNPEAVAILGLPTRKPSLYSLAEVVTALQQHARGLEETLNRPPRDLTPTENDLRQTYGRAQQLYDITHSFSLLEPRFTLDDAMLAKQLELPPAQPLSYRQVLAAQPRMLPLLERLQQRRDPPTGADADLLALASGMRAMDADRASTLFAVLPPTDGTHVWHSPWQMPLADLSLWQHAAQAYRQGDQLTFDNAVGQLQAQAQPFTRPWAIQLENAINTLHLWQVVTALYGISLLLAVAWGMGASAYRPAVAVLAAATLLHVLGLAMRVAILARPPVATLYESILMVGVTATLAATLLEARRRDGILLGLGGLMGTLLMLVALSYSRSGDTMGMLQAVLNTRFWLATHVLTITLGYGTCLLAGALAHIYLYRLARQGQGLDSLATLMNQTMMLGLALTAVGTFLGGIWADQSWGRFWGWDPKENGALLIVLWLAFVLHARIARWPALLVGARGTAVGLILNNIVVALAWFGVNLLNVGLHSYGFTQGIAAGLAAFCASQLATATWGAWATRSRLVKNPKPRPKKPRR